MLGRRLFATNHRELQQEICRWAQHRIHRHLAGYVAYTRFHAFYVHTDFYITAGDFFNMAGGVLQGIMPTMVRRAQNHICLPY